MAKSKSTSKISTQAPALVPAASGGQTAEDRKRMRQYQAEDDLRTLRRAEEIRCDKSRMSGAKEMAKKEVAALNKIK